MRGRRISLGAAVWIIIGVIVAANHHMLTNLTTVSRILSALLAVIAWPLVLLGVHVGM